MKSKNPGLFVSAPRDLSARQLSDLRRSLSQVALAHGLTRKSERHGSIYELLASIASGESAIVLLADKDRRTAIRELRKIVRIETTPPYVRDAFSSIADQLDAACQRGDSCNDLT